jgi:hypothetical protein
MTRLVKCYNLRFKIGVKIFFEEITGIRDRHISLKKLVRALFFVAY